MYLNVILTIFVVVQVATLVLIYKWWGKYGRKLFTSFTDMKKGFPANPFVGPTSKVQTHLEIFRI